MCQEGLSAGRTCIEPAVLPLGAVLTFTQPQSLGPALHWPCTTYADVGTKGNPTGIPPQPSGDRGGCVLRELKPRGGAGQLWEVWVPAGCEQAEHQPHLQWEGHLPCRCFSSGSAAVTWPGDWQQEAVSPRPPGGRPCSVPEASQHHGSRRPHTVL